MLVCVTAYVDVDDTLDPNSYEFDKEVGAELKIVVSVGDYDAEPVEFQSVHIAGIGSNARACTCVAGRNHAV